MCKLDKMLETPKAPQCYLGENLGDVTMGDQQASALELAWLAGLYDGEGSFYITTYNKKDRKRKYQPIISLANTDAVLINHAAEIISKMGITSYITGYQPTTTNSKIGYHVKITSMAYCMTFIKQVRPYLVGKVGQASLVLRFIESRLSHGKRYGRSNPYTTEESQMVDEIKTLNKRGAPETRRQAPDDRGEGIVRASMRVEEPGRNDLATSINNS